MCHLHFSLRRLLLFFFNFGLYVSVPLFIVIDGDSWLCVVKSGMLGLTGEMSTIPHVCWSAGGLCIGSLSETPEFVSN